MGKSLILAIDELLEGQAQAFQTVNDAVSNLEKSANALLSITIVANAHYTLSEIDFTTNYVFSVSGNTADINFNVPQVVNTITTNRVIIVKNNGTSNITVRTPTLNTTVTVPASTTGTVHVSGTNVRSLTASGGGGGGSNSATLAVFNPGLAPTGAVPILTYVCTNTFTFLDEFLGSRAHIGTNPTSAMAFTIQRNGTNIGSVTFSTAGVATFTTPAATAEVFVPGDRLTVRTPAVQDPTGADIAISITGTKV